MNKKANSQENGFGQLPPRALPIDDESSLNEDYDMPEEYGDAIAYLRGVRTESSATPNFFISKGRKPFSSESI